MALIHLAETHPRDNVSWESLGPPLPSWVEPSQGVRNNTGNSLQSPTTQCCVSQAVRMWDVGCTWDPGMVWGGSPSRAPVCGASSYSPPWGVQGHQVTLTNLPL